MKYMPSTRAWVATMLILSAVQRLAMAQPGPIPGFVACSYPLAFSPSALAVADFNQDGTPDLAVISSSNFQVAVLLTDPAEFATGRCLQAITASALDLISPGPVAIAAGDVDRNGTIDLVVAVQAGVVIARGAAGGSFSVAATPLAAGADPRVVAIADVDRDGWADIVVGNGNGNSVSILYGPAFDRVEPQAVNGPVTSMVVEDFNRDSFVDIAAVSSLTGQAFVFLQNPTVPRNFRGLSPVPVGVAPTAVVTGDFKNDGRQDLAVTAGGANGVLAIFASRLPGDELPPFERTSLVTTGTSPAALATADLNRDSALDVVVANQGDNRVVFFLGDNAGNLSQVSGNCGGSGGECIAGTGPRALALADVDGDGRSDVITANGTGRSLTFFLSSRPGPTPVATATATASPSVTPTPIPTATPTPGGDCCTAHVGPRCNDTGCDACVGDLSSFCATDQWDDLCVQIANEQCASACPCGLPTATPAATDTPLPTGTPSPTDTATFTPTGTLPPTPPASETPTATPTGPTATPTRTVRPTQTATPTVTATLTASVTPIPPATGTATPRCLASGVCVQGDSCAIETGAQPSRNLALWLVPPLLLWVWRRGRCPVQS